MATRTNLKKDPDANAVSMAPVRGTPLADTPLRTRDAVDEQFPAVYEKPSKKDAIVMAKLQMQTVREDHPEDAGKTPFGVLRASESDFKWLQSKREAEERANFDNWFAENFDLMSPAQKAQAKELYPRFYASRMALLDKQVELTREIARLKLNGVQDVQDLRLQYAIEKGIIDEDPLVNILHPEKAKLASVRTERALRFKRGLLSRNAYPRGNWGPNKRVTNAAALTGKTNASPASLAGVAGAPFSVYGDITSQDEKFPRFDRLLNGVMPPPGQAQVAQAVQAAPVVAREN